MGGRPSGWPPTSGPQWSSRWPSQAKMAGGISREVGGRRIGRAVASQGVNLTGLARQARPPAGCIEIAGRKPIRPKSGSTRALGLACSVGRLG
jgi:hypothetical protein